MSWWNLGEGSGYRGDELAVHRITCPFCSESGNFATEHHAEKRRPNSDKRLNFDTLKCGNCGGYVMCLWSASGQTWGGGNHDFKVLPWPIRVSRHPEEWPEEIGRYWVQAKRSLADENWDAAVLMARSAVQLAGREQGASGTSLRQEIDHLARQGKLPPLMKEWAHEVRELGNDAAHPVLGAPPTSPQDARDIVAFLDYYLEYLYSLPARISGYRNRPDRV